MKSKIVLFAILSFVVFSCSSDDNDTKEITSEFPEAFKITIDKNTPNEIVIDIDNPHAEIPCRIEFFTVPDNELNGTQLSNLSFFAPGILVIDSGSSEVGELVNDPETGLEEWGFTITIDGVEYQALSGSLSFTKYDNTDWLANGEPILISGVLDVIIESNGAGTRTLLINFDNVQSAFAGAC